MSVRLDKRAESCYDEHMTTTNPQRKTYSFHFGTPNVRERGGRLDIEMFDHGMRTLRADYRALRKQGVYDSLARGVILRTAVVTLVVKYR